MGQNQLIGEFLPLDIQELIIRVILAYLAADGIDEVGFAQAAAAVHKERVVAFGGVIGYRQAAAWARLLPLPTTKVSKEYSFSGWKSSRLFS